LAEITVFLKALTPEARSSLGGPILKINRFPFRVGRESRVVPGARTHSETRRQGDSTPNNDLYLHESGPLLCVSREHCLIDRQGGTFIIVDRGSHCGTLVEGELVGEKKVGGWKPLQDNDVIIVGPSESRYIYKFQIVESP
jgi:pSer/pThr/pTyr-binding forkhead associated (FHA) protein